MQEEKNKTIKESMIEIKKEKLAIVLKELLHLKYILNYYRTHAPDDKDKKTNKVDMSTANSSLRQVEVSLEKMKLHIDMLDNSTDNSIDDIYFLILHSKIGYDLNNTLYIIELIYKKIYQIFEESYHQYIPKPTLGRRFSNNNLVGNLKSHYESIIQKLAGDNKGLILSWSYRNYLSLEEKHEKFASNNSNRYGAYINLPYWYYEIPTLLPSVAHACARISISYDNFKFVDEKSNLERAVSKYLDNPRDDLSFTLEEEILSDKYNLTNKILADLISYKIYGYAYVYSLFNDIVGAGLSKVFNLKVKKEIEEYSSIKDYVENNFYWKASSYEFSSLRDTSIIRLSVLLDYTTNIYKDNDNKEHSKYEKRRVEMQNWLSKIISFKDEKSALEKIYENHPHYYSSFSVVKRALINMVNLYKEEVPKLELSNLEITENIDFNELWEKHFEENIHKNDLRKLLHESTLSGIQSKVEDKKKHNEIGIPHSLVFIKMHKKITCDKDNKSKCLDSVIAKCFREKDYYHAFGIYDLARIKNLLEHPEDLDETIAKKFNKIKELNNGEKERYYESRFSLMQIYPTIKGKKKEDVSNDVSILYNIDLTTQNSSAGETLANSICSIAEEIEKSKSSFSEAKIFKTLGPGDLIISIDGVSNSDFLELTEKVLPLPCIKRTFTTVLAKKDKKDKIKPKKDYQIVSFIRLDISQTKTLEDIMSTVLTESLKKSIESISITSGVLDLEIKWREETTVERVMDLYNRLMEESYIRDFQTKFNKSFSFNKLN